METYEKYKPSGIEWIGEVPEHWEDCRLKSLLKTKLMYGANESAETDNPDFPRYIRITDITDDGKLKDETFKSLNPTAAAPYLLKKGELLFARSGSVGRTFLFETDIQACFAGYLIKASFNNTVIPRYVFYFTQSGLYWSWISSISIQTTIQNIGAEKYNNMPFVRPTLDEQKRIVAYLDARCGDIDKVVATQEKRIALLKELKQSEITKAVTRGLNPDVAMKDSGVEWIGMVPEHWEVTKTLNVLAMPITDGPHETPMLYDEGIPFISAEAVSGGYINFDLMRGYISEDYYKECCKKYIPQLHDIYMIKSGATTGRVAMVETDRIFTIWSPLAAFRANNEVMLPYYLYYMLKSEAYKKQVELAWTYGTQQNIGMRSLERLKVTVPTIEEQKAIVKHLDLMCGMIDKQIDAVTKQIDLLREYKQSLITEVVTGKRRV